MSLLVNGRIPANTECPFKNQCEIAEDGFCHHTGTLHNVEFSCGSARGFDLIRRNSLEKEKNNASH